MTEVVSIKFKNRGKAYYFDPAGLDIQVGDSVIVDTANGMELAICSRENHPVEDTAVVQPLRRVLRKATQMDLRAEELAHQREATAMAVCREKIAEHNLDMKLVDVECNFEGSKTTFFFTSDGRVDFRALVKDLAAILHNRIELRQIGVRDEAKMLGGLGICGRPYCCNLFMDDFHPVSTKMAKVQSLSLNPAKISGSCGRLMCCLRYEQEAYEDLVKKVPKQGAFVETKDGFGTAVSVNLLRSTVKVRLDEDRDDILHEYKDYELTAVPGGRPKDGSLPPHVLEYTEPEITEEDVTEDEWVFPAAAEEPAPVASELDEAVPMGNGRKSRRSRNRKKASKPADSIPDSDSDAKSFTFEIKAKPSSGKELPAKEKGGSPKSTEAAEGSGKRRSRNRRRKSDQHTVKAVSAENTAKNPATAPAGQKPQKVPVQQSTAVPAGSDRPRKPGRSRRRSNRGKPAQKPSQDS